MFGKTAATCSGECDQEYGVNHCQRLAVTGVSHIMLRNCTECIACSYARFHLNVHGHSQTIYVSASRQKARLPANTIIFTQLQNLGEMFTERNELYCINALYLFGESEKSKSSPMIKLSSYMKSSGFGTGRALWLPHDVERRQVQWPWTSPQQFAVVLWLLRVPVGRRWAWWSHKYAQCTRM